MLDEIHTVTATVDGEAVAGIQGRLNEDDEPATLRGALVAALWDQPAADVARAFDEAFAECEAIPGDGAAATATAGTAVIEIRRTIG